jgi:segregation and condensation protein A
MITVDSTNLDQQPCAVVQGQPVLELPQDLYIPPDALEVFLQTFTGPLDLLLYLIRQQNLDILDIPIAEITQQYMAYIDMMQQSRLELAAEYLVMAAMLAEIKSRMLLPKPAGLKEEEADPRAELVRRLQEYELVKLAADKLDNLPLNGYDWYAANITAAPCEPVKNWIPVELPQLLQAMQDILQRASWYNKHQVIAEPLSVRERMAQVLDKLKPKHFTLFTQLFEFKEGRAGVVVTFVAILELLKQSLLEIVQTQPLGELHVRGVGENSSG